jgi:Protein of unknown function (DUF2855)
MDFLVRRDELHSTRFANGDAPPLETGQALLEVDTFGLTTNNVTYAVFGDAMSYWDFFPADEGWGRVPVWGFAEVASAGDTGLVEGIRVFGYLPPSTDMVVTPERIDARGFVDASPHRASLPSAYNSYARVDADPIYDPAREAEQMLLAPLYFTSFLLDDHLAEEKLFGASTAVLSSASSKTASSAAFLLSQRDGVEVVGLTSPGRVGFVEGLGVYDRVVPYEEIASLPAKPATYVDMSGDAGVRASVHGHYGDSLRHSAVIGATHREELAGDDREPLPGPRPAFFFAPDQLRNRVAEWGRERLDRRMAEAWRPYVEWSDGWLRVERGEGPEAVEAAYLELLDGRSDPAAGHVLSLR